MGTGKKASGDPGASVAARASLFDAMRAFRAYKLAKTAAGRAEEETRLAAIEARLSLRDYRQFRRLIANGKI